MSSLLGFSAAEAGQVLQVRGTRVLLDVSDMDAAPGAEIYGLDANGKRKALFSVRKVKNGKAVADVTKGAAQAGMSLKMKTVAVANPDSGDSSDHAAATTRAERRRPKGFWGQFLKRGTAVGLMGGLAQNTMQITAKQNSSTEDLTMKGNSYNLMGFYDYDFGKSFTVRGMAGLETYSVTGTSSKSLCNSSSDCAVSYNYLSGEVHLHYNVVPGATRIWGGLGAALLYAVSKSSTIPNLDTSGSTNQMVTAEGGGDIDLGSGTFVPVSFEYVIFPGGGSVKANAIYLRVGYGWRF